MKWTLNYYSLKQALGEVLQKSDGTELTEGEHTRSERPLRLGKTTDRQSQVACGNFLVEGSNATGEIQ